MADNPKKVAPRTLFYSEKVKAEQRYLRLARAIKKKIEQIAKDCTSISQLKERLRALTESIQFRHYCEEQARQIVTMLAVGQKRSWREAASASSRGRKIYEALMREFKTKRTGTDIERIIRDNAKLIRTVPRNVATQLSQIVAKRQFEGVRPEEITEEILRRAPELTDTQARRIARTESGKAATALIQARAKALGLDFYIWRTCKDERVRKSHTKMDGVVCRWDDPPDPEAMFGEKSYGAYPPHGIFNCRCEAAPVVDELDLKFPVRVHSHGSIVSVNNLRDFKAMFGMTNDEEDKLYSKKERKERRLFGFEKRKHD